MKLIYFEETNEMVSAKDKISIFLINFYVYN